MVLFRHAPSHLTVAGQRVLLSYEGQPVTCYGSGEPGHTYQGCPLRRKLGSARTIATAATYASIVTDSTAMQGEPAEVTVTGGGNVDNEGAGPQQ
jgi:methylaspartate ammonia-lyase